MSQTEEQKNNLKQSEEKPFERSLKISEEDGNNTLFIDDKDVDFTIDIYPETKTYQSTMYLHSDAYRRTEQFEYRIKIDPIKVETRLIERVDEPPERYCVKDGVVLESDILADRQESAMSSMTKEFIDNLKKNVEWHEDWVGDPVSMYILSKHPEIISSDDYRRHLRQFSEKIKSTTLKVEKAIASDPTGLIVTDEYDWGRTVFYPRAKRDAMSDEESEKAIEHAKKIRDRLFNEKSKDYVGVSESEFNSSKEILEHIEMFLNKKRAPAKKETEQKISNTKGIIISLILTFLLSWIVSWFVDINPFLIFIIVQIIAFAQSIVGGWINKAYK